MKADYTIDDDLDEEYIIDVITENELENYINLIEAEMKIIKERIIKKNAVLLKESKRQLEIMNRQQTINNTLL